MIDYNQAEAALNHLKNTDQEAARLKARWQWLEDKKKTWEAICFMDQKEGSQGEREKKARTDQRYLDHLSEMQEAHEQWLIVYNQRKSAELQIEMWRSVNSNQRRGNI